MGDGVQEVVAAKMEVFVDTDEMIILHYSTKDQWVEAVGTPWTGRPGHYCYDGPIQNDWTNPIQALRSIREVYPMASLKPIAPKCWTGNCNGRMAAVDLGWPACDCCGAI